MNDTIKYTHRFLARLIIETETPLAVGSGNKDVYTDSLIITDPNGLPMIPGTALSGVLRHSFTNVGIVQTDIDLLFGFQKENDKEGMGSRIFLSSAHLLGPDGVVVEGLQPSILNDAFYKEFKNLPIRQHVRITDKGVAKKHGKFNEQVVFKGTRFCFEIEMLSDNSEKDLSYWGEIMAQLKSPLFRLGGGTRKGFGEIEVVQLKESILNLKEDENDLKLYLKKTSSLNDDFWNDVKVTDTKHIEDDYFQYVLSLQPEDFYLFGSGYGDDEADTCFVAEKVIIWNELKPSFTEEQILIPATSIKGALAHRFAFHFNKKKNITVEFIKNEAETSEVDYNEVAENYINEKNNAVKLIFGYSEDNSEGQIGKVILSDLYRPMSVAKTKLINHVSIDRFTGGAIDGALYSEKVLGKSDTSDYIFNLFIEKDALTDEIIKNSFEQALRDISTGMLPLGGGTMRGNGCFKGTLKRCEETI